jgi:hypothetical protein
MHECKRCKRKLVKIRYRVRIGTWNGHGQIDWDQLEGYYCQECAYKLSTVGLERDVLPE